MSVPQVVLVCIVGVVLGGCTVGPDYHRPKVPVPSSFPPVTQPSTEPATQPTVDLARWWASFNDPELNRLIGRAIQSNLDVQLAAARVREARAQLAVVTAGLYPSLSGNASYTRSKLSKNAFAAGSGGAGGTASFGAPGSTVDLFQTGFDATWELDVFGGTRRAIESASDTLQAQAEARRNALVTLLSEVSRDYVNLRGYQFQLSVVRKNVAAQRETLRLQQVKAQEGLASQLNVAQAQAQVTTTEALIPTFEAQVQQMIHALSVLLGQEPAALEAELSTEAALPAGPPSVPPGLPSELLRRRPDVRQAERQLAAATANIGVATADLFPRFSLTGSLGLQSDALKTLVRPDSVFWSVGPSVSWDIFSGGRVQANIQVQNEREREALIQYRQAVLQALQDVDDALVIYDREQRRRESLQRAVEADRQAVQLSLQLNRTGLVDFLNVLTSQQSLYQAEVQLAQSIQATSADLVALYKALGGGWETFDH